MNLYAQGLPAVAYGGRCTRCGGIHELRPSSLAITAARTLAERITQERRLDFDAPPPGDPRFATAHLDGSKGPGRMLGVLVAARPQQPPPPPPSPGTNSDTDSAPVVVLKAFSGQMTETWLVPGWAGPLHAVTGDTGYYREVRRVTELVTRRIEALRALQRRRDEVAAERAAAAAAVAASVGLSNGKTPPSQQQRQKQQQQKQKQKRRRSGGGTGNPWISAQIVHLKARRRAISRHLLERVQRSYVTADVSGAPLHVLEAYLEASARFGPFPTTKASSSGGDGSGSDSGTEAFVGFPAGCGDCAAPKLLAAAAKAGLRPAALVEFFYGAPPGTATPRKPPRIAAAAEAGADAAGLPSPFSSSDDDGGEEDGNSGGGGATRRHLYVYGPCAKCAAILGTMLHGL